MIDDPEDYDDECFHDEYEIDILTSLASCDYCGHRWMLTAKDFEREHELQVEHDRQMARLEAEGYAMVDESKAVAINDDEIPF